MYECSHIEEYDSAIVVLVTQGKRLLSLPCVIAAKIYVVLPHYLGVFIDGKTRKIRYTHPSNRNQANMVCVRKRQRNYD